ncbi:MAG: PadR family transcriptional regulator [Sphaerobacteraceae bacterium]|nr:MAG: PadR family transcriptional regulator [Sphaerobacteraceae bacterium]
MSDKRPVSNPLALAVLSLLYERPMHPYEMATTLREREKAESIKLRFGSLYSVIDRLEQEGLIRAGERIREGKRPERTVYHITEAGSVEMRDWLRELVSTPVKEYPQFEAALSLLPGLPPDEAVEMLELRGELLDGMIEQIDARHEQAVNYGIPALFMIESDYRKQMLECERAWIRQLIEQMVEESWADIELLEGIPTWRQMHAEHNGGDE